MKIINYLIFIIFTFYGLIDATPMFCIDSVKNNENCISSFENEWFSKHLNCMKENSIYQLKDTALEVYRFTWLRTFHPPYVFKVIINNEGNNKIIVKKTNGTGGYKSGKLVKNDTLILTEKDVQNIKKGLKNISFWSLPTHGSVMGLDGAEWLLEGYRKGEYHLVKRWSPEKGKFRKFCLYLMKLANVRLSNIY